VDNLPETTSIAESTPQPHHSSNSTNDTIPGVSFTNLSQPTTMANQDINNSRFTKEAAEWDNNKKHVESTQKAFEAIQRYVPAFKDGTNKSTTSTSNIICASN
jgi:hypothetical protein